MGSHNCCVDQLLSVLFKPWSKPISIKSFWGLGVNISRINVQSELNVTAVKLIFGHWPIKEKKYHWIEMTAWRLYSLSFIACFVIGIWIFWAYAMYERKSFSTLPFIITTSFCGLLLSGTQTTKSNDPGSTKMT